MNKDESRAIGVIAIGTVVVALYALFNAAASVKMELIPHSLSIPPGDAISYLLLCLVIAGFTTALVQVSRMLFPLRGLFLARSFFRFLEAGASSFGSPIKPSGEGAPADSTSIVVSAEDAKQEFQNRNVSRVGSKEAKSDSFFKPDRVFDLPIEQLCGQISLAFQTALDKPDRFPNFIRCMVGVDGAEQLSFLLKPVPVAVLPEDKSITEHLMKQAEARAQLSRIGQQNTDAFQITAGSDWRWLVRLVVLALGLWSSWTITPPYSATLVSSVSDHWWIIAGIKAINALRVFFEPKHLVQALFLGLASAYLAMLLRDVAAIFENQRRQS
jgi:hypothetical protein